MTDAAVEAQNQRSLRKLILTVQANSQSLELLLAICDDRNLQASTIETYEAELQEKGIKTFRARLNPKQPSMRASLTELVEREPALQKGEPAVVTVLNADALLGVTLGEEKSEQERFFFSLQWTREALRRFEFAIVLWMPDAVATKLGQRAPDFWSWRGGVFEFMAGDSVPTKKGTSALVIREADPPEKRSLLSVEDLKRQIEELEKSSPESSLLITAYNALGEAYERAYTYDEALVQYQKALDLTQKKSNLAGKARTLNNLGNSLRRSGRSQSAIEFYEQGLAIYQQIGDRLGEANSLIGLGNAHHSISEYQQAVDFYQQSLEIAQEVGDRQGEANPLGSLGNAYGSLGEYQQAIKFQQQALEIAQEIGDRQGEEAFLGNLGNTYYLLGEYQRAIEFHQQSLEIGREIGNRQGEASSLGSLGNAYDSLCEHQQAIDFYQQSLEIGRETGDRNGEANSLLGLGSACYSLGKYQQAIDFYQQSLEIKQEIGDRSGEATALFNKGDALSRVDHKWEAQASYEAARSLYERLALEKDVEDCDQAIAVLNKQTVANLNQVPTIEKAIPSMIEIKHCRKRTIAICFLISLIGVALSIKWL